MLYDIFLVLVKRTAQMPEKVKVKTIWHMLVRVVVTNSYRTFRIVDLTKRSKFDLQSVQI